MEEVALVILVDSKACEVVVASELNDYAVFMLLNYLKVFLIRLIVPHLEVIIARASIDVTSDDEFTIAVLTELLFEPFKLIFTAIVWI